MQDAMTISEDEVRNIAEYLVDLYGEQSIPPSETRHTAAEHLNCDYNPDDPVERLEIVRLNQRIVAAIIKEYERVDS